MTRIERLFALRDLVPFSRLQDGERAIIVGAAVERRYEPGHLLASAGKPVRALFVVLEGGLVDAAGQALPRVFGYASLLTGLPIAQAVRAAPVQGATCLAISRGYFFTILYECPELAAGFLDMETPELGRGAGGGAS